MKASEVLRDTKAVLFEAGWTKGELIDHDERVCLVGALWAATFGMERRRYLRLRSTRDAAHECAGWHNAGHYLCRARGYNSIDAVELLTEYNDPDHRTFDEICDLIDLAEKLAEADETASRASLAEQDESCGAGGAVPSSRPAPPPHLLSAWDGVDD